MGDRDRHSHITEVIEGKPELTPVAIQERIRHKSSIEFRSSTPGWETSLPTPFRGSYKDLASVLCTRIFWNGTTLRSYRKMDYTDVATTVFTPIEYGCVPRPVTYVNVVSLRFVLL